MKKKLASQTETMVKPRPARPTVQFVDTYCELYRDLFVEVRAYESFKYLQLGLISDLKRKSLPARSQDCRIEKCSRITSFYQPIPVERRGLREKKIKNNLIYLRWKGDASNNR